MSDVSDRGVWNRPVSRRGLLQGGAAATFLAGLAACDAGHRRQEDHPTQSAVSPGASTSTTGSVANVRVTHDGYREHVGPSVACNPRNPDQLFVACQASPVIPEIIATYLSTDGGATWNAGGPPPQPKSGPAGDDVSVAYDIHGRGYICATRSGGGSSRGPSNPDANRGVYVWTTDDGGRSYSTPSTVVEGAYFDHPWLATGGPTPSAHEVYVAWGAGDSHTAVDMARSTDGGRTFAAPRRILEESSTASLVSAGPQIAANNTGMVLMACDWTTGHDPSGDMIGQVVAVCSNDAGQTFGAPVHLGAEAATMSLPGDVRPNSGPAVAMSADGDALYVAFPTRQPGASTSAIVVTASSDRGRTWTTPTAATPDDGRIYFQPNLAVDDQGRLSVSAFALGNGLIDEVLVVASPGPLHFGPLLRITTESFNPLNQATASKGKYGAWWLGDWQGLTSSPGAFHLVWNDTRTGKLDLFAATVRP